MVGGDQNDSAPSVPRVELGTMREARHRWFDRESAFFQQRAQRRKGHCAERNRDAQASERIELFEQVWKAVSQLRRRRLVLRRRAAHRGGDQAIAKRQAVVAVDPLRLRSKAGAIERRIQKITRAIAGKGSSGAIAAVGSGREADDQNAGAWIAERRNRSAPIGALAVRAFALARDSRGISA
jgi:hypothetical protein